MWKVLRSRKINVSLNFTYCEDYLSFHRCSLRFMQETKAMLICTPSSVYDSHVGAFPMWACARQV